MQPVTCPWCFERATKCKHASMYALLTTCLDLLCALCLCSDFMAKVFVKSGLGLETTYLPPGVNPLVSEKPQTDVNMSNAEAEMVMQGCVTELLERECGSLSHLSTVLCLFSYDHIIPADGRSYRRCTCPSVSCLSALDGN